MSGRVGLLTHMTRQCASSTCYYLAGQSQKAVSAYFTSKQILALDFVEQYSLANSVSMLGDTKQP